MDRLLAVDVAVDLPEDIEQVPIHRGLFLATPVTQEMVELLQRFLVVAAFALEGHGEVFAGMGVVERQGAGFVQGAGVVDRADTRQQQHRGDPELISGLWQRRQIKLACETDQHVVIHPYRLRVRPLRDPVWRIG